MLTEQTHEQVSSKTLEQVRGIIVAKTRLELPSSALFVSHPLVENMVADGSARKQVHPSNRYCVIVALKRLLAQKVNPETLVVAPFIVREGKAEKLQVLIIVTNLVAILLPAISVSFDSVTGLPFKVLKTSMIPYRKDYRYSVI